MQGLGILAIVVYCLVILAFAFKLRFVCFVKRIPFSIGVIPPLVRASFPFSSPLLLLTSVQVALALFRIFYFAFLFSGNLVARANPLAIWFVVEFPLLLYLAATAFSAMNWSILLVPYCRALLLLTTFSGPSSPRRPPRWLKAFERSGCGGATSSSSSASSSFCSSSSLPSSSPSASPPLRPWSAVVAELSRRTTSSTLHALFSHSLPSSLMFLPAHLHHLSRLDGDPRSSRWRGDRALPLAHPRLPPQEPRRQDEPRPPPRRSIPLLPDPLDLLLISPQLIIITVVFSVGLTIEAIYMLLLAAIPGFRQNIASIGSLLSKSSYPLLLILSHSDHAPLRSAPRLRLHLDLQPQAPILFLLFHWGQVFLLRNGQQEQVHAPRFLRLPCFKQRRLSLSAAQHLHWLL